MLLILKRHGCEAIVIDVDQVHSLGKMFGWFRPGNKLGFGLPWTWIKKRFEGVALINQDKLTIFWEV